MMNSIRVHIPEHLDLNPIKKQHPLVTIGGIMAVYSWQSDLTNPTFHLPQAHSGERSSAFCVCVCVCVRLCVVQGA